MYLSAPLWCSAICSYSNIYATNIVKYLIIKTKYEKNNENLTIRSTYQVGQKEIEDFRTGILIKRK